MSRYKFYFIAIILSLTATTVAIAQKPNFLTKSEKQNGWRLLFDGKTFNGWQKLANTGWLINRGELMAQSFNNGGQKDIITTEQFGNFELIFEFKISKATNSGIKYLVTNNYPGQKGAYLGLEYQILDEVNFKYPERGVYRSMASLYDLIPAKKNGIITLNSWNIAKVVVNDNHIEHWLNGNKVVEYDRSTSGFRTLVEDSKYKNMENFGMAAKGHILLQNEGTPVVFRSIKIKPAL